jgi:hypothetical protein
MKKTILAFTLFISVTLVVGAQTAKKSDEDNNCYLKWAHKFESRGADDVADGSYSDVIIVIRNGSEADCFSGKCDVKEGKVIAMYIKMEDGKFELLKKKARYDIPITINNGMSLSMITMDDEIINVLFVKKIKPKKASFEKAAEPTDD